MAVYGAISSVGRGFCFKKEQKAVAEQKIRRGAT
jgi:hypothetical protein